MKICVTAKGESLDSEVDPRFGGCRYFIIVDTDSLEFEAVENLYAGIAGGAGIQSGQLVSEKQVSTVLTGNVGPNAFHTLNEAQIEVITAVSGTVKEVVQSFKDGVFIPVKGPTIRTKSGL
jgi:predicted Fe-Mo cluster-binding NifX family protein